MITKKDEKTKKKLLGRLKRAQGQVSAVHRMLEEDAPCMDVLTQISAAQGALDKAGQQLLSNHIQTCVHEAVTHGNEDERREKMDELMALFDRYTRIGGSA